MTEVLTQPINPASRGITPQADVVAKSVGPAKPRRSDRISAAQDIASRPAHPDQFQAKLPVSETQAPTLSQTYHTLVRKFWTEDETGLRQKVASAASAVLGEAKAKELEQSMDEVLNHPAEYLAKGAETLLPFVDEGEGAALVAQIESTVDNALSSAADLTHTLSEGLPSWDSIYSDYVRMNTPLIWTPDPWDAVPDETVFGAGLFSSRQTETIPEPAPEPAPQAQAKRAAAVVQTADPIERSIATFALTSFRNDFEEPEPVTARNSTPLTDTVAATEKPQVIAKAAPSQPAAPDTATPASLSIATPATDLSEQTSANSATGTQGVASLQQPFSGNGKTADKSEAQSGTAPWSSNPETLTPPQPSVASQPVATASPVMSGLSPQHSRTAGRNEPANAAGIRPKTVLTERTGGSQVTQASITPSSVAPAKDSGSLPATVGLSRRLRSETRAAAVAEAVAVSAALIVARALGSATVPTGDPQRLAQDSARFINAAAWVGGTRVFERSFTDVSADNDSFVRAVEHRLNMVSYLENPSSDGEGGEQQPDWAWFLQEELEPAAAAAPSPEDSVAMQQPELSFQPAIDSVIV